MRNLLLCLSLKFKNLPLRMSLVAILVIVMGVSSCSHLASSTNRIALSESDLAITKTDNPDPVTAGNDLTDIITVTNNGPSNATGVSVIDAFPAEVTYKSDTPSQGNYNSGTGMWTVGNLDSGRSATLTLAVTVNSATTGTITNHVAVTGNENDPDETNNSAFESTTVNTRADLAITKTDNLDPVTAGNDLTYIIKVTNNGPSNATGVSVTDTLPAGVTYKWDTPSQGSYNSGTGVWMVGNLASGHIATLTLAVTVNSSTTGTIANHVAVTGNENDPDETNNSAFQDTTVNTWDGLSYLVNSDPAEVDNTKLPITSVNERHITGSAPEVDIATYRLTVDGLVDTPLTLTYEALMQYPTVTDVVLLICRGVFADNAQWTGVPVATLLAEAGIKPQASQVTFYALDGYHQTLSLEEVQSDGVFLAHTVDGQILPKEHGYPLRLVVTGEYGYKWVKWVERIEVT